MSVNISLIVLEKMYDILMILVEIFHDFGWLFATRIRIRNTEINDTKNNDQLLDLEKGYQNYIFKSINSSYKEEEKIKPSQ